MFDGRVPPQDSRFAVFGLLGLLAIAGWIVYGFYRVVALFF